MRPLVVVLEWLVLLPLWRAIFKPKILQGVFAAGSALVWLIIIVTVVAAVGGGGGEKPAAEVEGQPSPTGGAQPAAAPSKPQRVVQAVAGAVAEAENIRVTLLELTDPWTGSAPEHGTRYVAVRVAVENLGDHEHGLSSTNFHLDTSSSSFEAMVTFFKAKPDLFELAPFLHLSPGGKLEGWVNFVVAEGAELKRLSYDPNPITTDDIEFHFQ